MNHDELQQARTAESPRLATVTTVDRTDIRHLGRVFLRWWVLLVVGALGGAGLTVALLASTTPSYEATATVLIDQPLSLSGEQGFNAAQKLVNLMPTYAEFATSDGVLNAARTRVGLDVDLDEIRRRVDATAVPAQLIIRIRATDANSAKAASDLADAVGQAFATNLQQLQKDGGVTEQFLYKVVRIVAPEGHRPSRNEGRSVVLAAGLGVIIMAGVALLIDAIER
jgi:capsular polysaccharide biosynthesis protein